MRNSPAVALKAHVDSSHVFLSVLVPRITADRPVDMVNVVKVAPGLVANPAITSNARGILYAPVPGTYCPGWPGGTARVPGGGGGGAVVGSAGGVSFACADNSR